MMMYFAFSRVDMAQILSYVQEYPFIESANQQLTHF